MNCGLYIYILGQGPTCLMLVVLQLITNYEVVRNFRLFVLDQTEK